MSTQRRRHASAIVCAAVMLSTMSVLGTPGTAEASVPVVQYVTATSAINSVSPKMVAAQCPFGMSVLGGGASIKGADGQVTIQAAFPTFDAGLAKYVFVVKAVEDLSGTLDNWSVTASAYCTSSIVATFVDETSAFDSNSIKSATVHCPAGTKVVGMGGEVSTSVDSNPAPLVGNIPPASVVFQGFDANDDLTQVTARATEVGAALFDSVGTMWKITAIAACSPPAYFDALELLKNTESGGGLLATETESTVEIACPKAKQVIAAGSALADYEMGQWYLHRFSSAGGAQKNRILADAYRDAELGTVLMKQTVYAICVDK